MTKIPPRASQDDGANRGHEGQQSSDAVQDCEQEEALEHPSSLRPVGAEVEGTVAEDEHLEEQRREGGEEHAHRVEPCLHVGSPANGQGEQTLQAPRQPESQGKEWVNPLEPHPLHHHLHLTARPRRPRAEPPGQPSILLADSPALGCPGLLHQVEHPGAARRCLLPGMGASRLDKDGRQDKHDYA
jgi:hypothetical protein